MRRLTRIFASFAADVNTELILERGEAALERADYAGGNSRRMPVHAHDSAEGLEPERIGKPPQQLVAAVMMDYGFAHHRAETSHAIGEPLRHAPAMQRKIGASRSLRHHSAFRRRATSKDLVTSGKTSAVSTSTSIAPTPPRHTDKDRHPDIDEEKRSATRLEIEPYPPDP